MPRQKRFRRMSSPPRHKGLRPFGGRASYQNEIILNYEEYETIRLNDYENYTQEEGAAIMDISRPTYTRIYSEARKKVATALVESRPIIIKGGHVYFENHWFHCKKCQCWFDQSNTEKLITHCVLCGSSEIEILTKQSETIIPIN